MKDKKEVGVTDGAEVPKAVGEFALKERAKLLSNNADLRARLAKYEDAEGRSAGLTHDQAELVGLVRDLALRSGKHARPLMHAAALGLESQAREIERLSTKLRSALLDSAELAALKAQPVGVLLPERWNVPRPIWKDVRQPYGNPLNHADIEAAEKFNLAIDEIARLNSSPVSAGQSCEPDGVFATYGYGPHDCPDCGKKAAAQTAAKTPERRAALGVEGGDQISAGEVDERAVKIADRLQGLIEEMGEDGYHGSEICIAAHDYLRNLTVSAPSHSEQVREGWVQVPKVATPEMKAAIWDELDRQGFDSDLVETQSFYYAGIAAAPSAGSQGGDV